MQEVATCDRLWNRERQSLSQATQLASKLNLDHPGMVHAVKHVTTGRKSATYIIFDRGYGQPDDDGGDEGEDEDAAPAATEPKSPRPSLSLRANPSHLPSRLSQPRGLSRKSRPAAPDLRPQQRWGSRRRSRAQARASSTGGEAGLQRAQRVRRLSARYRRLAGARPRV